MQAATPCLAEQAFVCGVIHDVGKIAMAVKIPEEMVAMLTMLEEKR